MNKIVILVIIALVIVGLCLKFIKGVVKFIVCGIVLLVVAASFNLIKIESIVPSQCVNDVNKSIDTVNKIKTTIAESKDNIKIGTKDNVDEIKVKIGEKWYSIKDFDRIEKTATGKYTVSVNGESIKVENTAVKKALDIIMKGR